MNASNMAHQDLGHLNYDILKLSKIAIVCFYHELDIIPCRRNSSTMKGRLVMTNTVMTVRARLVVFSLALDMYLLSPF